MTIFICGGILGHLGFGLYDNFHLRGVFWDTSDLDSMTIFIFWGYSGTTGIWTLLQYSFGGILGHLRFGLFDNFHLGGVFWDTLGLDSMTIFIWGGSILGHPGFLTPWQFSFWGVSGTPRIWTLWQFSLGGLFWDTSDLDSMKIFIWGGILGHLRFGLPDNFHFGVFWDTLDLDSITTSIGGEYSLTPWIWILWQFSFGGIFRDTLDLDSLTIFIGGEHSGTPQIWTLWQYSFGSILGHLRFGLYDNFHLGGVFWDTLDFYSMTIFILKVEYSGTPFFLTPWKFSFWGYLEHLGFGLYDNFHFGGLFWDTLDLDSMTIFI